MLISGLPEISIVEIGIVEIGIVLCRSGRADPRAAGPSPSSTHHYWVEPGPQPVHLSMHGVTQLLQVALQGVFAFGYGEHEKMQAAAHDAAHAAICPVPPHVLVDPEDICVLRPEPGL
jgi:hypothetical protein